MKKRVGILGGTFDPIHFGHLLAAEQAREQTQLDEVWFLPAQIPPHKKRDRLTAAEHRYRMVELAIADNPAFSVTDIELKREGPSYTFDTMQELIVRFPEYTFFFIIGGDMVEMLPRWYRFEELTKLIRFIGLARPGSDYDAASASQYVTFVEIPQWDLSSTQLREKLSVGKSVRYLVPPSVDLYIKENGLYGR